MVLRKSVTSVAFRHRHVLHCLLLCLLHACCMRLRVAVDAFLPSGSGGRASSLAELSAARLMLLAR